MTCPYQIPRRHLSSTRAPRSSALAEPSLRERAHSLAKSERRLTPPLPSGGGAFSSGTERAA